MYRKIARIVFLFSFIVVLGSFFFSRPSQTAEAQTITFSGYGWSSLIGWMQVQGADYGIKATPSGTDRINLSGYAWTSTLGWISFDSTAVIGCASSLQPTTSGCAPYIDMTGTGPYRVRGFARACSVFESGCSGQLKSNVERGDWDGYISLNSGNGAWGWRLSADKTQITGYAWGDSVVGWLDIDATCSGCDTGDDDFNDSFSIKGCVKEEDFYTPSFTWDTDPVASWCTVRRVNPAGGRIETTFGKIVDFNPMTSNMQVPENESATYSLVCGNGESNVRIVGPETGISVARCAPPTTYCPNQTFTAAQAGGDCMCPSPNGTVAKTSTTGSNCPSSSFCPAPNQTILKADAAGSNCPTPTFCPPPNGAIVKADAAGSNCPASSFCPAPNQTVLKIDAAGSNCGKKPPKIIEI